MTPEDKAFCDSVIVAGSHGAKYHTFQTVERILAENIPGDFAECGVMAGGHPAVIAYVLRKHNVDRKIHMFDSFDGIPQASVRDDEATRNAYGIQPAGPIKSTGVSKVDLDGVKYFLRSWGFDPDWHVFRYHKGWFQEVMAEESKKVGPLALLRLDVDLYESTKPCLQYLYPKVVQGGYIVDDDYSNPQGGDTACRLALFEYLETIGEPRPEVAWVEGNPDTAYWRKS